MFQSSHKCSSRFSASSMHMGIGDGVIKNISENDSVVPSFPSTAAATDLLSLEPSNALKVREILSIMSFFFFFAGKYLFLVTDICF